MYLVGHSKICLPSTPEAESSFAETETETEAEAGRIPRRRVEIDDRERKLEQSSARAEREETKFMHSIEEPTVINIWCTYV